MHDLIDFLRPVARFMLRRSVFLVLGASLGYAYGYHHADGGQPSLYSRAESLAGVDHVRDDHMRRRRAIDALKQAQLDSLEGQIPR